MNAVPTTDQIRHNIDSGKTGEKIGHPDPATVPLGTDAEAGGNTPTRQERAIEAKAQIVHREPVPLNGPAVYLMAVVLVAALALVVGFWALAV